MSDIYIKIKSKGEKAMKRLMFKRDVGKRQSILSKLDTLASRLWGEGKQTESLTASSRKLGTPAVSLGGGYTSLLSKLAFKEHHKYTSLVSQAISILLATALIAESGIGEVKVVQAAPSGADKTFEYTGRIEEYIVPESGVYNLEVWGAQGGECAEPGGKGGYSSMEIALCEGDKLYVAVGGKGVNKGHGGYNGGGDSTLGGSGGGATHIATKSGLLADLESSKDSVLIVGGGGGGTYHHKILNVPGIKVSGTKVYNYMTDGWTVGGHGGGYAGGWTYCSWDNGDEAGSSFFGSPAGAVCIQQRYLPVPGDKTSGYAFGRGETGLQGGGAGWYGAGAGKEYYIGGSGGSGYIRDNEFLDKDKYEVGIREGNGKARIRFIRKIQRKVTVNMGDQGLYQGQQTKEIWVNHGDMITLDGAVGIGEFTFSEWIDMRTGDKVSVPFKVTGDMDLKAYYSAPLTVRREYNTSNPNTINLYMSQSDSYPHYYKVYQSQDKVNWYNAAFSEDADGRVPKIEDYSRDLEPGKYTYEVKVSTDYKIRAYGASGGDAYQHAYNVVGYGGKGAYTEGTVKLKRGDVLNIDVGTRGVDGHEYLGGAGKGTEIMINGDSLSDRIMVAGGGGNGGTFSETHSNGADAGILVSPRGTVDLPYHKTAAIQDYRRYLPDSFWCVSVATQTSGEVMQGYVNYSGYPDLDQGCNYNGTETWGQGNDNGIGSCGYYNGAAQNWTNHSSSGGGSTSYISGYTGCIPAIHPSGYKFTDIVAVGGIRTGDGHCYIDMASDFTIGDAEYMNEIYFYDKAAPNKPSDGTLNYTLDNTVIKWRDNGDNGSVYYHKVESYNAETDNLEHTSNILEDYLESGVKGFYWYVDTNPTGTANQTHAFTEKAEITIPTVTEMSYIHIAAIDNAGNLGETYDLEVPAYVRIQYINNNETVNRYGDPVSTTATGDIKDQYIEPDTKVLIKDNKTTGSDIEYKKVGYDFIGGWNTKPDGTGDWFIEGEEIDYRDIQEKYGLDFKLYAVWEPIRYNIVYKGNGNWNTSQGDYKQEVRFDQELKLLDNKYSRPDNTTYNGVEYSGGYVFIGWGTSGEQNTPTHTDKQSIKNLRNTAGDYDIYALWKKEVSLTFDTTGAMSPLNGSIVLKGTIYNSTTTYTFNINKGMTAANLPKYSMQEGTIDAYGEFDENGVNSLYKKVDISKPTLRFIGWSEKGANETGPDWSLCPYNTNRQLLYTVRDNTTLYAIWEPILSMNLSLNRELGDMRFDDGSMSKNDLKGITATNPEQSKKTVSVIIKPGEQGLYKIDTLNDNAGCEVIFDTDITKIYDIPDKYTDDLNPKDNTEALTPEQKHGLNRSIVLTNHSTTRDFHIPTYLVERNTDVSTGTPKTRNIYLIRFKFSKPSYYYKSVYGKDEEAIVNGAIFISDKAGAEEEEIGGVLDELRTELRIRIQQ